MKKLYTTLSLLTFFSSMLLAQTNYYVSTTGNNSNTGTSTGQAWKTIQYAANTVAPGAIINIMGGTYHESITVGTSGTAGSLIIFQNYNNEEVILSGTTLPPYSYIMKIENQNYIRVSGLKFQDYQQLDAIGIYVINSSNVHIENNEFSNIDYSSTAVGETPTEAQNSQPIIVFGRHPTTPVQNIYITNNTIHDCELGWSEALSINGNVDGFEISHNHVYNNTNIGIVAIGHEGECPTPSLDQARNGQIHHNLVHDNPIAYAQAAGIYIDGAKQMLIENNTLYNNSYGIEIGCENNGNAPNDPSANDILVRNNLIYNNSYTGIALGGYNYPTSGKVEHTTIRNNTCFNNDTGNNYQGEMMISYTENSLIENNIFYTKNTDKVLFTSTNTANTLAINYNLFYTPSGENDIVIEWNGTEYNTFLSYKAATFQDNNSLFTPPLFIDNSCLNSNLHLLPNSPAKNAGRPSFLTTTGLDMDEEARINEGRVDIGADEYYTNTIIEPVVKQQEILFFPNPTSGKLNFIITQKDYVQIAVFDISGKLVYHNSNIQQSKSINLSQLEKGVYFIKIKTCENTFTRKVLKH